MSRKTNQVLNASAWASLAPTDDLSDLVHLAGSPDLDPETQRVLLTNPSEMVRARLAGNPFLVHDVQEGLSRDGATHVRKCMADNPFLAPDLQVVMSFDDHPRVLAYLANNETLTLSRGFSVAFLTDHRLLRDYLRTELVGLDTVALNALLPEWEGSLETLLAACRSFAA